jgi:mannitol 2-dehydrogenase
VVARIDADASFTGLALVSALWARYCYGESEGGTRIAPNDPNWSRLNALAKDARVNPAAWLSMGELFGELSNNSRYIKSFTDSLSLVWSQGTRAALSSYVRMRLP